MAEQCPYGDECGCAIGTRHFWYVAFNRERDRRWASAPASPPPAPSGWQAIETAPKDGTKVLLCSLAFRQAGEVKPLMDTGRWEKAEYDEEVDGWAWCYHMYPVTHWMPLPAAPSRPPGEKV